MAVDSQEFGGGGDEAAGVQVGGESWREFGAVLLVVSEQPAVGFFGAGVEAAPHVGVVQPVQAGIGAAMRPKGQCFGSHLHFLDFF